MTTLLTRLLARLGRPAAPPPAALPVAIPKASKEAIAFAFSVDGVLLATLDSPGHFHFHNHELFYEIPEGRTVCLVTGGAPTRAEVPPASTQAIDLVVLYVSSFHGNRPVLGLLDYDDTGKSYCVEHRLREGRNTLRVVPPLTGAARAVLKLSGSGRLSFASLKLVPPSATAPTAPSVAPPPDADPLLALVAPDHKAARIAGAEIPPPS